MFLPSSPAPPLAHPLPIPHTLDLTQISPLRIKRKWHQEDPAHIRQMTNQEQPRPDGHAPSSHAKLTASFSEFDSRFGRHADPLFSRHETTSLPAGVDPMDPDYIFVDPHVLATPIIADTDGDGVYAELVVAVSYYFDPYRYGDVQQMDRLNGLEASELVDYTAGCVVIIDLDTGKVKGQHLLGITRGVATQPGYLLATPTAVRLTAEEPPVVIIGSVMGELHMLAGDTLQERAGFPVLVDSIAAQVAVGDLFNSGKLDLVVGDYSGNVYCIDRTGKRVWEREVDNPISAGVRFADVEGDGLLEVILATRSGDVWVLNGQTGQDHAPSRYPIHLNSGVEASVLVVHLRNKARGRGRGTPTLGIIVPTSHSVYIVDAASGCVEDVGNTDHVIHEVAAGDVDPYNPGLELLGVGLDGTVVCFGMSSAESASEQEAWSLEPTGQSIFTHKASSFYFVLPFANTSREINGATFDLSMAIHSKHFHTAGQFSLVVSVGRKDVLLNETVHVQQRVTELSFIVPTPPTPVHTFLTVQLCNRHQQCQTQSSNLRFNLHAEDHLQWFLCLPFLCVCAMMLWLHRNHSTQSLLPTTSRKEL